jgi:hypothetical protein
MTLMFDNSRSENEAFNLVRAQRKQIVLYDCRDSQFKQEAELVEVAGLCRLCKPGIFRIPGSVRIR